MSLTQFRPVFHEPTGAHLIDCCYFNNCPADVALRLATFVIAMNVTSPVNNFTIKNCNHANQHVTQPYV